MLLRDTHFFIMLIEYQDQIVKHYSGSLKSVISKLMTKQLITPGRAKYRKKKSRSLIPDTDHVEGKFTTPSVSNWGTSED